MANEAFEDAPKTSPAKSAAPVKAQSEIGPTTFGEGGEGNVVKHGPDDPETKRAYAAGHPSKGIAAQREDEKDADR